MEKERQYWAVGAFFKNVTVDKANEFFVKSVWYDGYALESDYKYGHLLNQIKPNDIFLLKSRGVRSRKTAFTRLKAIGIVENKINESTFSVKWFKGKTFPIDFEDVLYMRTIEKMRNDSLLEYSKKFICLLNL